MKRLILLACLLASVLLVCNLDVQEQAVVSIRYLEAYPFSEWKEYAEGDLVWLLLDGVNKYIFRSLRDRNIGHWPQISPEWWIYTECLESNGI
jgi:hypothetical protein